MIEVALINSLTNSVSTTCSLYNKGIIAVCKRDYAIVIRVALSNLQVVVVLTRDRLSNIALRSDEVGLATRHLRHTAEGTESILILLILAIIYDCTRHIDAKEVEIALLELQGAPLGYCHTALKHLTLSGCNLHLERITLFKGHGVACKVYRSRCLDRGIVDKCQRERVSVVAILKDPALRAVNKVAACQYDIIVHAERNAANKAILWHMA